jgi:hypothetical protein
MVDRSRRGFLYLAGCLAGGSAVVAIPTAAIARATAPAAVMEPRDPIIALAERFLEADRESGAAYIAADEFEPMLAWRQNNPRPVRQAVATRPRAAWDLNLDGNGFFDMVTGEKLSRADLYPGADTADFEHKEAMRKWKRREAAAKRRTGHRALERASEAARLRFHQTQDALTDCIPLGWDGLAAKSRAFRKTYAHGEHWLMMALMRDIAVLSGQIDRDEALRLNEEELGDV